MTCAEENIKNLIQCFCGQQLLLKNRELVDIFSENGQMCDFSHIFSVKTLLVKLCVCDTEHCSSVMCFYGWFALLTGFFDHGKNIKTIKYQNNP